MDPLPVIGFWVLVVFLPIGLLLTGILMWRGLRSSEGWREMTVPRWIGLGLGTTIIVVILGNALIEYLAGGGD